MPEGLENFLQAAAAAASGSRPFLLAGPDAAWIVRGGPADIFAVDVRDGQPAGRREHLFRAEPGSILFSLDPERYGKGIGLVAVGKEASFLKTDVTGLRQAASDPRHAGEVARLIDNWVEGLAAGICREVPPITYRELQPGEVTVGEELPLRPRRKVLWVCHEESDLAGLSMLLTSISTVVKRDAFFPVTAYTWLYSIGENRIKVLDTAGFLQQDTDWSGLEEFHKLVLDIIALNRKQARLDEGLLLDKKTGQELAFARKALTRLAASVQTGRKKPGADHDGGNAMLQSCIAAGEAAGIKIVAPPFSRDGRSRDPLGDIARASRVRTRRVSLGGEWWTQDGGPMVAFMKEDERPVALLPASPRSYTLYDPGEGKTLPVTAETARQLKLSAYSFFRPFPARALSLWDLIKFCAGSGWKNDVATVALTGAAGGLLALALPVATGFLFDSIIPGAERGLLLQTVLFLLAAAAAVSLFKMTGEVALLRIEGKIAVSLEAGLLDRLLSLPLPFFRRYSAGDLAVRAGSVKIVIGNIFQTGISSLLGGIFSLFNLALLLFYDVRLALVAAALVLAAVAVTLFLSLGQLRYQKELAEIQGKVSSLVMQVLGGIAKFRVAGAENRAFYLWAGEFARQRRVSFRARLNAGCLTMFNAVFPPVTSLVIFAAYASTAGSGLSTGRFLAFNAAFGGFLASMLALSSTVLQLLSIVPAYERARPILETAPEVDESKADPGELKGDIEVSHVYFSYGPDDPPVLKDVSIRVRPGEFVAVVGPSGSGKSTLLRLLLGLDRPHSGAVYYDGQDLAGLDVRAVRSRCGVVVQNSQLMAGDIFTNIAGLANLTMNDAWEAARMAGIDEEIRQMPMGMFTMISEGAANISGGQRQRLLIARALVKKPRIVFFDEATSALDNHTQAIVSRSLEKLQATRVVIAHRLSTIINADRIYVLDQGRVVQSGSYEQLMREEGLFAAMARRQLA
ncbi:MAG TPA: NHLP bacteriocin export ABC transporter permease/ATPase subunit [Bacillota bacterium]|nr:NHLP bacteriocin export ABC transporter permease/ATPase subunit [Bacillota bacterium]